MRLLRETLPAPRLTAAFGRMLLLALRSLGPAFMLPVAVGSVPIRPVATAEAAMVPPIGSLMPVALVRPLVALLMHRLLVLLRKGVVEHLF